MLSVELMEEGCQSLMFPGDPFFYCICVSTMSMFAQNEVSVQQDFLPVCHWETDNNYPLRWGVLSPVVTGLLISFLKRGVFVSKLEEEKLHNWKLASLLPSPPRLFKSPKPGL